MGVGGNKQKGTQFMIYNVIRKTKRYYFTVNTMFYLGFILFGLPVFIRLNIFNFEPNLFDKIWSYTMLFIMLGALFFSLYKSNKYKTLKGKLISELEFQKDKIVIDKIGYQLNDIKKISIENTFDYKGRYTYSKGNFDGSLSNGLENELLIYLNNDEKIQVNFQQVNEDDILNEREILIHYSNRGKLHYLNLLKILRIEDYGEIQNFKTKYLKQL